ncbi:putative UTP--glucose-1-phosphate uridylyltransferase [Blattamonas nauphoetae]|uniref:UTP--glucose-1-phosphate uridylyltransferase n=1 Tax=Blattamonas nauphoetae TaxID=2049346 RepID=A0ABQ9XDE7_9EUKA|nr:putative UTP--glucose-1-phosphate uridylyltransferase [Blattamonas nauphoetae]
MDSQLSDVKSALSQFCSPLVVNRVVDLLQRKESTKLEWSKIKAIPKSEVPEYSSLSDVTADEIESFSKKFAVLKLNGGLGTSMGLQGPKSIIEVKDGKSYLDILFEQIRLFNKAHNCSIPLIFMNSFNTEAQTKEIVSKNPDIDVICFNQHMFPRLDAQTLLPIAKSNNDPPSCFYPPGHGDLYDSLNETGTLSLLRSKGIEYVFISNIDNLGATIDIRVLAHLIKTKGEVLLELTPKTPADAKGGTVVKYTDDNKSRFRLVDTAMVPTEHQNEFKTVRTFPLCSTNNLWINLAFLESRLQQNTVSLDVIQNPKTVDGRKVLQLETACGAIVGLADELRLISVPRSRFIPTKSCSDLFLIRSNVYQFIDGELVVNPQRSITQLPTLFMGGVCATIQTMQDACPVVPDLLEAESVNIVGNVRIGKNVSFRGNVVVCADDASVLFIPDGSILDNVVVRGHLTVIPRV